MEPGETTRVLSQEAPQARTTALDNLWQEWHDYWSSRLHSAVPGGVSLLASWAVQAFPLALASPLLQVSEALPCRPPRWY